MARKLAAAVSAFAFALPAAAVSRTDAEIVAETIEVNVSSAHGAFETGSRTLRVLTEAGIDQADLSLPVYPFTEVLEVRGTLTTADGKKTELEGANVLELPYLTAPSVAQDLKIIHASFPGVGVGSTVRYSWRRRLSTLLYVDDWVFRGELPIQSSTYRLVVPKAFPVRWVAKNGETTPQVSDDGTQQTFVFSVRDTQALERELFAPPLAALVSRVQFFFPEFEYGTETRDMTDWGGVADFYRSLATDRYDLDSAAAAAIRTVARKLKDPKAIVQFALDRLSAYRYVQVYLGMGGYQPHAAAWTQQRRYGDCKDLATILIGTLRAAGIEAYPMLTRIERGYQFLPDVPSPKQFNHCVVYVPLKDGPIVLDGTAPRYCPGSLPGALGGAPGLVVRDDDKFELLTLPAARPDANRAEVDLDLQAAEGGGLHGTFVATLTGDHLAAARQIAAAAQDPIEGDEAGYVLPLVRNPRLSAVTFQDTGSTLRVEGKIQTRVEPLALDATRLVSASMLIEDHRLAAFGAATRKQPIDLGEAESTTYRFHLPAASARCPEPIVLESSFGSYGLHCSAADGALALTRTLTVTRPWIEPGEYARAREFWQGVLKGDRRAAVVVVR